MRHGLLDSQECLDNTVIDMAAAARREMETPTAASDRAELERTLYCSFCYKSHYQVKKLISGPANIFICDDGTVIILDFGIALFLDYTSLTERGAFVGTLQAKAVLKIARDNLAYWDHVLGIK